MGYYSSFENNLNDMYFDAGALTEDIFTALRKNIHFQNFLYITNPTIHLINTSKHGPHITMIEFPKNGADEAKGYHFNTDLEYAAKVLNQYADAPLSGDILRSGEKIDDIEKYIIDKNGTVTTQKARIVFE